MSSRTLGPARPGSRLLLRGSSPAWRGVPRGNAAGLLACAAASLAGGETLRMSALGVAPPALAMLSATAHRACWPSIVARRPSAGRRRANMLTRSQGARKFSDAVLSGRHAAQGVASLLLGTCEILSSQALPRYYATTTIVPTTDYLSSSNFLSRRLNAGCPRSKKNDPF